MAKQKIPVDDEERKYKKKFIESLKRAMKEIREGKIVSHADVKKILKLD